MSAGAFTCAYAQARLQARLGARPGEAVWDMLHALLELPALLEQARTTSLRHWITNVAATTAPPARSEERRVGKQCHSEGRSRWSPYY